MTEIRLNVKASDGSYWFNANIEPDGEGGWKQCNNGIDVEAYDMYLDGTYIDGFCASGLGRLVDLRQGKDDMSAFNIVVTDEKPSRMDDRTLTLRFNEETDANRYVYGEDTGCYVLADLKYKGRKNKSPWSGLTDEMLTKNFKDKQTLYMWAEEI